MKFIKGKSNYSSKELYFGPCLLKNKGQDFYKYFNYLLEEKRNILKHVKLKDAIPVAVYDHPDDSHDFVWFYIKGRMVDYTVDIQTDEKLEGSSVPQSFCEYWQFIRSQNDTWVLNEILQEDEAEQVPFTEDENIS
jgi:hypothetical protein